jgi:hypothetical protein
MSEKKRLYESVPKVNPEKGKKLDELVPDTWMESVRRERAITELKNNRLKQARIDSAMKELEGGQKTVFTGMSLEEAGEIAKLLPPEKVDDFTNLGVLMDRTRKLEPREARREIVAFLRVWPKPNRGRDYKFYAAGMKTVADKVNADAEAAKTGSRAEALLQSVERALRTFESLESG